MEKDLTLHFDSLRTVLEHLQEADVSPKVDLKMGVGKFPVKAKLAFPSFLHKTYEAAVVSSSPDTLLLCLFSRSQG